MRTKIIFIIFLFFLNYVISPEVITKLDTDKKYIALTFDACETITPSYFDDKILDYLLNNKIPFTLFISGKFAKRNQVKIRQLSKNKLIEIENHSLNHILHMEKLSEKEILDEVIENEHILEKITGKKPLFFIFPGGFYDKKTLSIVESLGYKVVHWSFESGDPDKNLDAKHLIIRVLKNTKPGNILIFHINRRGWSTGEALPDIIKKLRLKGYKFVLLKDFIS